MQPLISVLLPLLGQQRIDPLSFAVEVAHGAEVANLDPRLILSLVTVAIGITVALFFRRVTPRTVNDGKLLFSELCGSNHLSGRQQKLLLEMARRKQVACPSQMLLDANLWTPDENQPPRWESPKIQEELARLRSLLFTHAKQAEEQMPSA